MSQMSAVMSTTGALTAYVAWVTTTRDAPPVRHEFIADDASVGLRALLAAMPRGSSATCRPLHRDVPEHEIRLRTIDVVYTQRSDGKRITRPVIAQSTMAALGQVIDELGEGFAKISATVASAGACIPEDGASGMAWWNDLSDADRRFWMLASMGTSPSDAWEYRKRCCDAGLTPSPSCIATLATGNRQ